MSHYAVFQVNINSVLGSGVNNPEDALKIAHRAVDLGFTSTVGIIHDNNGQLKPLGDREQSIFEEIMELGKRSYSRFNEFQHNVARGREHNWRCRSGSRYLYICEKDWCTGARNSADIRGFRWRNIRQRCGTGNIRRKNFARRDARFRACSRWAYWTTGAGRRI